MKVLVLPSRHGRGHLARMGVLATALKHQGAEVDLAPPGAPALELGRALWDAKTSGTLPMVLDGLGATSRERVQAWVQELRVRAPDIVVSDADPAPLAAAAALSIPARLVSNFTWTDLASAWCPDADLGWLASEYAGTRALVLPLALPMRGSGERRPVPHLAEPRGDAPVQRRAVLALGFGDPETPVALTSDEPLTLEASTDSKVPRLLGGLGLRQVEDAPRDRMPGAQIAIVKASYGAVSEAIAARTPMLLLPRRDSPEDARIVAELTTRGIAVEGRGATLSIPDASTCATMRAAYVDAPWAKCDPDAVARAVLDHS